MTGMDLAMKSLPSSDCSVLIVGDGPCGLVLANELGRRAITKAVTEPGSYTMNRENRYERAV